jgi:hypothetical protein
VRTGLRAASLVAPRVAEDPAREHDKALRGRLEVHLPAGLIESTGEYLREFSRCCLVGFEVQGGPGSRLVGRAALGPGTC